MGIFDSIFGNNSEEQIENVNWYALNEVLQLEQLENESENQLIVIFKHSTRCGISRMALKQFEKEYDFSKDAAIKLYLLDLVAYRELSNRVATKFNVVHESPQLIVIQNKEVVYHASHQDIRAKKLSDFVEY